MSSIDYNNTTDFSELEVVDNDVLSKLQELRKKLEQVEKEKQEMHDQYNVQRAKMQKLFLQKEDELRLAREEFLKFEEENSRLIRELDETKSQVVIARLVNENELDEERAKIAQLQKIACDKTEESSSSQNEVKNLQKVIQTLQGQLAKLTIERDKEGILQSTVLSLAKKVVGQLGPDSDRSSDNLEESMKQAQQNADVIRSLVMPLEKQIDELKEKLAATEEKLNHYENANSQGGEKKLISWSAKSSLEVEGAVSPSRSTACDMCANYETQLQAQQQIALQWQKQKEITDTSLEKFKEDLAKETQFRKEMEEKWNVKKEEQKLQVIQLKTEMLAAQKENTELQNAFSALRGTVKDKILQLAFNREEINSKMELLQKENENLVGKHSKHSEQLRNESINFPDTVEELQELLLKLHEELIAAKVGKEAKEESEQTLWCEIQLLRDQMQSEQNGREVLENTLTNDNLLLRKQIDSCEKNRLRLQNTAEQLSMNEIRHNAEIQNLKEQLTELSATNVKSKESINELKKKVASLQHDLNDSERVQKDFVRLSQSLQIQLEKIRNEDTQVRWQHDEDVVECPGCKHKFTSSKQKEHCRHCGQVFCLKCLPNAIPSGPKQRLSRVCEVCLTLLNRNTPPYFSQEAPHSPD